MFVNSTINDMVKAERKKRMTETPMEMTFEQALSALEDVVRQLESGRVQLEEAVAFYEKGVQLKKICEEKLKNAKARIDKLVIDSNGEIVGKENFDVDAE